MSGVDLTQWLGAQLDEDERIARAACEYASPEWHLDDEFGETVLWWAPEFHTPYEEDKHWRGQGLDGRLAPHIAAHDPARVLREIEAKRRQVEWCVEVIGDRDLSRYDEVGSLKDDKDALAVTLAVETLRLIAWPYDARPGYRAEWAPSE